MNEIQLTPQQERDANDAMYFAANAVKAGTRNAAWMAYYFASSMWRTAWQS